MKKHPYYLAKIGTWEKARKAVSNDSSYVNKYLKQYSHRETLQEFNYRKQVTPNPSVTRISLNKLCKSVRAHLHDVSRKVENEKLAQALRGERAGVDGLGSNANTFIGGKPLRELLITGRVGIFCARDLAPQTVSDEENLADPYLTVVPAEDILNWSTVPGYPQQYQNLVIRSQRAKIDPEGLVEDYEEVVTRYDLVEATPGNNVTIRVRIYESGSDIAVSDKSVDYPQIPFTMIDIEESPVVQALNNHDALLQLTSSDHFFLNQANFPLFTEQFDLNTEMQLEQKRRLSQRAEMSTVDEGDAPRGKTKDTTYEADFGVMKGRRYPKGTDRPDWVAPPTAHLDASYTKQDRLEERIKEIFDIDNLELKDTRATAESKREDKETLSGAIQTLFGLFERSERISYAHYQLFFGTYLLPQITFPADINLKSVAETLKNATERLKVRDDVNSIGMKRALTKQVAQDLFSDSSDAEMEAIFAEIEASDFLVSSDYLIKLSKERRVNTEYILKQLALPASLADKFKADRLEELSEMVAAQTNPGAGRPEE